MAAGLAAGGVRWFGFRDVAEPATVEEAVTTFREQAGAEPSPVPAGVYVYDT